VSQEGESGVVSLVSAGVDWITVTQKHGEEMDQLRQIALSIAEGEHLSGMFGRPWAVAGYEGFSVGHMEYGERHDGCILQLHSHLSHAHWKRVFELGRNVSRLDSEITIRQSEDPAFVVRRHLGQMRRFNKGLKRPAQLSHKVSPNRGMTIYSGSPKSDVMLRIYDKERESNLSQWSKCTRYEVQFRRRPSLRAALNLLAANNVAAVCARQVSKILHSRGAVCRPLSEFAKESVSLETSLLRPGRSDSAKVCEWLRKSVAPSVQRLLQYNSREMVLDVLGLAE